MLDWSRPFNILFMPAVLHWASALRTAAVPLQIEAVLHGFDLAEYCGNQKLALRTPGIWPLYASSRKQIRQMP